MTPTELDDAVALCMAAAKVNLAKDDHLIPAGLIIYGDGQYDICQLGYDDTDSSKQAVANQFIAKARQLQATAVITIFDAWCAMVKEAPANKRVRDLPEARDCIVVSGHMPDYQTMATSFYVKTDKGFVFEDDEELAEAKPGHSRFTDGIWETHSITDVLQ